MNIYYWFFEKLCFFKTGKYTCIEKSTPMKLGDKAWLMSTMIKLVAKCLTFWYNMYNVQHVRRNRRQPVYVSEHEYVPESKVWQMIGNQGPDWRQARVTLDSCSGFYVSSL
ncbi:hypothetical protein DPMN_150185 [Dreissena polymorpha]|uniref:MAM domain-containing protein n=1 Tax=Dreissena polymorpha TaxID=45954 RepID=A0A9D4FH84_DREPO|nr:hypothetical protein DPMN_150185 [Dreissena polymorpha]